VFAGGFDLDAAEAVCGATPDTLAELVDHSLVQVSEQPERRFRLLETVREYAAGHQPGEAVSEPTR
jgi:predicted ATPase